MSEDHGPGYDFFPVPGSLGHARGPSAPPRGPRPGPFEEFLPRQSPWGDAIGPARQSGAPRWVLVTLILILLLITPAALATAGIPLFVNHRLTSEYEATLVQLPSTFNGIERNTGPKAQELSRTYALGPAGPDDVAVYGRPGPTSVILLALKPAAAMSPGVQDRERRTIERAFAAQGMPLFLLREPEAETGRTGDWAGCGHTQAGLEVCLTTDTGSLVAVISGVRTKTDPVTLLRQAREATVTRITDS